MPLMPSEISFRLRSPHLSNWPCSRTKPVYLRAEAEAAVATEAAGITKTKRRTNTNHDAEDNYHNSNQMKTSKQDIHDLLSQLAADIEEIKGAVEQCGGRCRCGRQEQCYI